MLKQQDMDRQKQRDYDIAIDYVQWSKDQIEELESTIQKMQDENEQLDKDLSQEREEVRSLESARTKRVSKNQTKRIDMENKEHRYEEIPGISHTTVHDKGCMGCIRHKKDVLVVLVETADGKNSKDLFFSTEQAEKLIEQLQKVLERNKEKQNG